MIPGIGYGEYYPLKDFIGLTIKKKGFVFELKEDKLFVNSIPLQGLQFVEKYVRITGEHYTSWENATQIKSTKRIDPSIGDPFVYISEPGKMKLWKEKEIRKELGCASANTEVKLTVLVPIERVWIKVFRRVAHYAIIGMMSKEILKLAIQKRIL